MKLIGYIEQHFVDQTELYGEKTNKKGKETKVGLYVYAFKILTVLQRGTIKIKKYSGLGDMVFEMNLANHERDFR